MQHILALHFTLRSSEKLMKMFSTFSFTSLELLNSKPRPVKVRIIEIMAALKTKTE